MSRRVSPGSEHRVVFAIENPKDTAIAIREIRADCDCIAAINPPTQLAAKALTRVTARLVVPDVQGSYGAELILLTDDAQRRVIRLKIHCTVAP